MDVLDIFQRLGLAAALGLLVGLQREHAGTNLAGIRTFPLVTLLGGLCALLGMTYGGWLVGAGLFAIGAMLPHPGRDGGRRGGGRCAGGAAAS